MDSWRLGAASHRLESANRRRSATNGFLEHAIDLRRDARGGGGCLLAILEGSELLVKGAADLRPVGELGRALQIGDAAGEELVPLARQDRGQILLALQDRETCHDAADARFVVQLLELGADEPGGGLV